LRDISTNTCNYTLNQFELTNNNNNNKKKLMNRRQTAYPPPIMDVP
jgi:hypothetical protein